MSKENNNGGMKLPPNNSKSNNKLNTNTKPKTAFNPNQRKRKRKKKKNVGLILGFSLIFIFILGISIIGTIFFKSMNDLNQIQLDKSKLGIAEHDDLKEYEQYDKIKNILLLGTDQPTDSTEPVRSDTMMILTVDPIHNKIKVTSLMRDANVNINGHGDDKLTHAYAYGGAELAIRTINENFGLNIEEFASVDFSTLPKVIDLLGGIEVNITPDEFDDVNGVIFMDNRDYDKYTPYIQEPGLQTLTGDQVLGYARNRSSEGGDYARTQRQRTVIEALFKKGLNTSVISYPSILSSILPYVTTNMTTSDILSLGKNILATGTSTIEQARFPLDENSWGDYGDDGFWYLFFNRDITKKQVQDYIFDDKKPEGY